jgi:D-alanyl-D-alanine dipeptidase
MFKIKIKLLTLISICILISGCSKNRGMTILDIKNQTCRLTKVEANDSLILDIKYATEQNNIQKKLYKTPAVYLHSVAAEKLERACIYASKLGFKIKLFDAFRPLSKDEDLRDIFKEKSYLSDGDTKFASHSRGIALDLTLVDVSTDKELDMGTSFGSIDEDKIYRNLDLLTKQQLLNRMILSGIMQLSGFDSIKASWWHYDMKIAKDKYMNVYDNLYPKLEAKSVGLQDLY